jgi:hypothetical protein
MEAADKMETMIIDLYAAGTDVPAAIDLVDEVVAIIRRKDKPRELRLKEIGRLIEQWAARPAQIPAGANAIGVHNEVTVPNPT